ncbi:MAG TPA: hypothetical protein VNC78_08205 [Actinomycetota bacterium]|nr:hypothetical protein [Actinomycetota bacterium]
MKRWVFLMTMLPLIAIVVEMIEVARSNEPFSWLTVAVVVFLGESTFATAWSASNDREGPRNTISEPWRGLLVFVGVMVFLLITEALWGLETPSQLSELGITAGIAAIMTLVWYVRYTVLAPIIVSAFVAWPVAAIMYLFTFWMGSSSFLALWGIGFVLALPFVVPVWAGFVQMAGRDVPLMPNRRPRARRSAIRVPAWALIGLTCLFVWTPALFTDSVDERRALDPRELDSYQPAPVNTYRDSRPLPVVVGAPGQEAAARQLMDAWKLGDRALAARVALQAPLDAMFAVPIDPGARFDGCDADSTPAICRIATVEGVVVLEIDLHPDTNWFYVTSARSEPPA